MNNDFPTKDMWEATWLKVCGVNPLRTERRINSKSQKETWFFFPEATEALLDTMTPEFHSFVNAYKETKSHL